MKMNNCSKVLATCTCVLGLIGLPAQAGVVVVAGSKSPVSALTAEQVSQLYVGKSKNLPGAGDAILFDQAEGSAVRDTFYTKATGKSASQVKALWARLLFSGAAQPPAVAANAAELKKLVAANPSAVGYLDSADVDASVKVILKLD